MEKWKATVLAIKEMHCNIIGLSETCVNWNINSIRQQFQKTLSTQFKNSSMSTSTSKHKHKGHYLPGGTMMATVGKWNSIISGYIFDDHSMARWSGTSYQVTKENKLHIITAYRVCPNTNLSRIASLSTYAQQKVMLFQRGIHDTCPRKQFTIDIIEVIRKLRANPNDYVLLALDANDPCKNEQFGMTKIKTDCRLVNAYTHKHRDFTEFATQNRGTKCIDHMVCTPNLLPFIKRIGYVRFNEAFDSDHRAIFCDICDDILDNNCIVEVRKLRMVGTNSTNAEGERYIEYLHQRIQGHNIFLQVNNIFDSIITNKSPNVDNDNFIRKLNVIDNIVTELMILAEKKCCSKKDPALWSPQLYQSSLRVQYLNVKRKSTRQRIDSSKRLQYIWQKMDEESRTYVNNNVTTLTTSLQNAIKEHNHLIAQHRELRMMYLQEKLDDLNKREPNKKQTTLSSLMSRERKRSDFAKVRNTFKQGNGKGITTLEIMKPDGNGYETITEPSTINNKLLQRNIKHFAQAESTPFTMHPIQEWFQYEGTNQTAIKLVDDKILPSNIDELPKYVQEILRKLADGNKLDELSDEITYEEYLAGIVKWNEKTTTSPSGRHLGHYKLLTRLSVYDKNNPHINLSQQLLYLYYQIAIISAKTGNSLNRWKNVTTCMIEKVKGVARIDKLRVIHIYEADYNLLLKIVWARKGVWNSHVTDALHEGQAGSRPGKRAIEVVVKKEMKYLYARLTRTGLGTIDNDAKSCFDRIVCNLAMLISGYYGIPKCYRQMQATTLKNTKFTLSTAMGLSTETYQHTNNTPIHGTGQGSCASPALWLFISSFLMDILEKEGNGIEMHDILKDNKFIQQWIEGFVDDTSIFTNNGFHHNDIKELKRKLQHDGTWWAGLLEATGGKLEISKCFYYLLTWRFDKHGNPHPEKISEQDDHMTNIILKHNNTNTTPLEQKDISISHKTLGAFKTIDGTERDHITFLSNKSMDFAERATNGQFNRRQAKLAYTYNYIPSMTYSLTAMTLNEHQLEIIQKKAVTQFIRLMGYDACFPRGVVYGPKKFGGLEIQQLYVQSVCSKIECIICNINANNILGRMAAINLNWLQLHSGKSTPILEDPSPLNYIKDNWFIGIKTFLNKIQAYISIKNIWKPTQQRINDLNIMDIVDQMDVTRQNKTIFNNWRLFFRVIYVSDITNVDGNNIRKEFLEKSEIRDYVPRSKLNWPIQLPPNLTTFRIWKTILQQSIQMNHYGKLHKPLGLWVKNPLETNNYKYVVNTDKTRLYSINDNNIWHKHQLKSSSRGQIHFDKQGRQLIVSANIQSTRIPVDVHYTHTSIYINKRTSKSNYIKPSISPNPTSDNMKQYITQISHQQAGQVQIIEINEELMDRYYSDAIEICSDGGLCKGKGGIGIVISINQQIVLRALKRVKPTFNKLTSYRTEAIGVMSALYMIIRIQQHQIIQRKNTLCNLITVYCDNESVINMINKTKKHPFQQKSIYQPDADVFMEIKKCVKIIKNSIIFKHIKGHQDRINTTISYQAHLNCLADDLATTSLATTQIPQGTNSAYKATLHINNLPIYSDHTKNLRDSFNTIRYMKYLRDAFSWDKSILDNMEWNIFDKAINTLNPGNKTTIHKFIHKRLPCNKREHLYYPYLSPHCKLCNEVTECSHHVLQCPSCPKRNELRKKFMKNLRYTLTTERTNTTTVNVLIYYINAWLYNQDAQDVHIIAPEASQTLINTVREQTVIGWEQIFSGRWSKKWGELYDNDVKLIDHGLYNPDSTKWGTKLISLCFTFVIDSWQIRNDTEYDENETESTTSSKAKIIRKIIWIKNRIGERIDHIYTNIDEQLLQDMPLPNLEMIDEHLTTIHQISKNNG